MQLDWIAIVFRWLHLLAAITAVGGTIFMRMALAPAVESLTGGVLTADQRKSLHEAVRSRWVKFIMAAILFLIVSGVYNFVARIRSPVFDPQYKGIYHGLFGTKVLLALVIFFLASALTGRSEALAKIRQNATFWLTVNVVLAVLVVCISGVLRFIPTQAV